MEDEVAPPRLEATFALAALTDLEFLVLFTFAFYRAGD